MTFALVNSMLLPFLAVVAVPVLLHFFARAKPPVYPFSSVTLLTRVLKADKRVKRPRHLLLLLVRTALVAAIVLAFLRPLLFPDADLAAPFRNKSLVVLVDASASMGYVDGAQTRFALACAEASELLGGLGPEDRANLIWLRARPVPVFPELGRNHAYLRQALRRAQVGFEAADIPGALALAGRMLEDAPGSRELCLVSDFQRTAWESVDLTVPRDVKVVRVPIGTGAGPNVAVTHISTTPAEPLVGERVAVLCEIGNFSDVTRPVSVYVGIGEQREHREVSVPAWERATATFDCRFPAAGPVVVAARIGEDEFAADNERWHVVPVKDCLRVGIGGGDATAAASWRHALSACGWAEVRTVDPAVPGALRDCDAVLLAGWRGDGGENLANFLDAAGTVVCLPASGCPLAAVADLVGGLPAWRETTARWRQQREPFEVRIVARDDPALNVFGGGEYGDPTRATFSGRVACPPWTIDSGRLLLAYTDGVPALATAEGAGTFVLWNLALSAEHGTLVTQPEFVPLLGEVLLTSRRARSGERHTGARSPGDALTREFREQVLARDVTLADVDGARVPVTVAETAPTVRAVSGPAPRPGLYTWAYRGTTVASVPVNLSPVESDFRVVPEESTLARGTVAVTGGSRVLDLRDGIALWPTLLALGGVLVAVEALLLLWKEFA